MIQGANRSHLVEQRVREYLVTSGALPGDKLPSESDLAGKLRVSRTAVREALRALEAVGMISTQHGKGRFVNRFDFSIMSTNLAISLLVGRASLKDILEVRKALETSFLPRAARLLTEGDFDRLDQTVERMRSKLKTSATFVPEDMEFHRVLFNNLNNPILLNILEVFWKLFGRLEETDDHPHGQLNQAVRQHQAIVTALRKGDLVQATRLLNIHFEDAEQRIAARDAGRSGGLAGTAVLRASRKSVKHPA